MPSRLNRTERATNPKPTAPTWRFVGAGYHMLSRYLAAASPRTGLVTTRVSIRYSEVRRDQRDPKASWTTPDMPWLVGWCTDRRAKTSANGEEEATSRAQAAPESGPAPCAARPGAVRPPR